LLSELAQQELQAFARAGRLEPVRPPAPVEPLPAPAPGDEPAGPLATPARIAVSATRLAARVGDPVGFEWWVSGARTVRIEAPDRGETYDARAVGSLQTTMGPEAERFVVVATGRDGVSRRAEIHLSPLLLDALSAPLPGPGVVEQPWE
jgi:hypothetical protein